MAVVHRLSDLKAAGQEGSEQQRLAEGLLADAETRVVFGQVPGEAERAGELLGLSRNEQALLCQLPRGVACGSAIGNFVGLFVGRPVLMTRAAA